MAWAEGAATFEALVAGIELVGASFPIHAKRRLKQSGPIGDLDRQHSTRPLLPERGIRPLCDRNPWKFCAEQKATSTLELSRDEPGVHLPH
jgi:hypothetical protein